MFLPWDPFIRCHKATICGIENFYNPLQYGVVSAVVLLESQFSVRRNVSLFLQVFDSVSIC